jgi:hypothetical protein
MTTEVDAKPEQSEAQAGVVRRAGLLTRSVWEHDIENGTPWTAALSRNYWARHLEKFRSGDRVEIHSGDHRIQFTMLILDINIAADPVYLDTAFIPVYPTDLRLPQMSPQPQPRYAVRQAGGYADLFNVIDLQSGKSVSENPQSRSAALELASTLERGAALSAEQAVDLAARRGSGKRSGEVA